MQSDVGGGSGKHSWRSEKLNSSSGDTELYGGVCVVSLWSPGSTVSVRDPEEGEEEEVSRIETAVGDEETMNETAIAVEAAVLEVAGELAGSVVDVIGVIGEEVVSIKELIVVDAVELLVGGREERDGREERGQNERTGGESESDSRQGERWAIGNVGAHVVKVVWQNETLVTRLSAGAAAVGGKGSLTVGRSSRGALSTAGGRSELEQ